MLWKNFKKSFKGFSLTFWAFFYNTCIINSHSNFYFKILKVDWTSKALTQVLWNFFFTDNRATIHLKTSNASESDRATNYCHRCYLISDAMHALPSEFFFSPFFRCFCKLENRTCFYTFMKGTKFRTLKTWMTSKLVTVSESTKTFILVNIINQSTNHSTPECNFILLLLNK